MGWVGFWFFALFVCFLLIKGLEFSIFIYACMCLYSTYLNLWPQEPQCVKSPKAGVVSHLPWVQGLNSGSLEETSTLRH